MINPLSQTSAKQPQPIISYSTNADCPCETGNDAELFTDLQDVPQSYAGQGGKIVSVKNDGTGLEFTANSASGWKPMVRVARDDPRWFDDHTFVEPAWTGSNFFVYYNGNKILTPENEGFTLTGSGFTYDPARFQFYTGEFLYVLF
jgi:hypothetical protein